MEVVVHEAGYPLVETTYPKGRYAESLLQFTRKKPTKGFFYFYSISESHFVIKGMLGSKGIVLQSAA